jgi:hypothetical protein
MSFAILRSRLFMVCLIFSAELRAQDSSFAFIQLYELDSIGHSASIGKYFGSLYFDFLKQIEKELDHSDTATKRLVRNFEINFAQFYIDACTSYCCNKNIEYPAWQAYFRDSSLKPIQYKLLGANAHLNGQLAEAIASSYTPEEWKWIKSKYLIFNVCLTQTYRNLHKEAVHTNRHARWLHYISLGLDKPIGQYHLYKWRKRQMRLTEYYYQKSPKYDRLLRKINKRKKHIDWMVRRLF